jgi:AraC family transcriptional regulator, transcriptional activator of pobA
MKAERIDSSLHPRSWSFNRQPESVARQFVLLTDGAGEAEADSGRFPIAAPAILWLGDLKPGRLRAEAGATGYRCWASDAVVIAAIGDQAESVGLRYLADRSFVLSLSGLEEQATVLERCCRGIIAELAHPLEGSSLLLSGLMRIMLVAMIRVAGGMDGAAPAGIGEKSNLLQRFRQLVEMNFRSHWTIARYAQALGISTDRLHAICTTGIGKSPKALVSERLAHEAALRLERSSLTIQQLGHSLGFNDPAHFSSFFRRMAGVAPGRYRKMAAASRLEGRNAPTPSFADWP